MLGFLQVHRNIDTDNHMVVFNSWNLFTIVDSVGESRFCSVVDTQQVSPTINLDATWPISFGALSGGPVFCLRGEIIRLELAGITYEASDSLNAYLTHHADFVRSDGTIIIA